MAESVFSHEDDGGVISVFASGSDLLFACSKGDWWIVAADKSGKATAAGVAAGTDADADVDADADLDGVTDLARFGDAPLRIMNLE